MVRPFLLCFIKMVINVFYRYRIRNCLTQLYAKDITPDDKQELDEALQREVCHANDGFIFPAKKCISAKTQFHNKLHVLYSLICKPQDWPSDSLNKHS